MTSVRKVIAMSAGPVAALLVVLGAVTILGGFFPMERDVHPPCDQLPRVEDAVAALGSDHHLAAEIEGLGSGVTVVVGRPCLDDASRGLVLVNYETRAERSAIRALLARRDGFGVPIHLARR